MACAFPPHLAVPPRERLSLGSFSGAQHLGVLAPPRAPSPDPVQRGSTVLAWPAVANPGFALSSISGFSSPPAYFASPRGFSSAPLVQSPAGVPAPRPHQCSRTPVVTTARVVSWTNAPCLGLSYPTGGSAPVCGSAVILNSPSFTPNPSKCSSAPAEVNPLNSPPAHLSIPALLSPPSGEANVNRSPCGALSPSAPPMEPAQLLAPPNPEALSPDVSRAALDAPDRSRTPDRTSRLTTASSGLPAEPAHHRSLTPNPRALSPNSACGTAGSPYRSRTPQPRPPGTPSEAPGRPTAPHFDSTHLIPPPNPGVPSPTSDTEMATRGCYVSMPTILVDSGCTLAEKVNGYEFPRHTPSRKGLNSSPDPVPRGTPSPRSPRTPTILLDPADPSPNRTSLSPHAPLRMRGLSANRDARMSPVSPRAVSPRPGTTAPRSPLVAISPSRGFTSPIRSPRGDPEKPSNPVNSSQGLPPQPFPQEQLQSQPQHEKPAADESADPSSVSEAFPAHQQTKHSKQKHVAIQCVDPPSALKHPTDRQLPLQHRPTTCRVVLPPSAPKAPTDSTSKEKCLAMYVDTQDGLAVLRCPACSLSFSESVLPVALNCHHSLCQQCVRGLANGSVLSCPSCGVVTDIGVGAAPRKNFALSGLAKVPLESLHRMQTGIVLENLGACCPVCLDSYKDRVPVMLSCGHSVCQECLGDIATHHRTNVVECPECRKPTDLRQRQSNVANVALQHAVLAVVEMKRSASQTVIFPPEPPSGSTPVPTTSSPLSFAEASEELTEKERRARGAVVEGEEDERLMALSALQRELEEALARRKEEERRKREAQCAAEAKAAADFFATIPFLAPPTDATPPTA
eukprot:RCo029813